MTRSGPTPARLLLLFCCALGILLVPAPGHAQGEARPLTKQDIANAKRHYDEGAALYERGDYKAAGEQFQEAYRISHLADLLFNLSRVAEHLGQRDEAIRYLEKYLQERPTAPDRPDIEKKIESLKMEERELAAQANARIQADQAARIAADKAQQAARLQADQAARPQDEQAASRPSVRNDSPSPAPPAVAQTPSGKPSRLPPWPALALLGGGTGFLIIGISLGAVAISTARQVESGKTFNSSLDSQGRALSNAAIALDVIGALALAGGGTWTALWYVHRKAGGKDPMSLRLAPAGLGLGLSGSF